MLVYLRPALSPDQLGLLSKAPPNRSPQGRRTPDDIVMSELVLCCPSHTSNCGPKYDTEGSQGTWDQITGSLATGTS